nr:MAG TPA: hypothetical protein [Caudoviricetes sp.]
MEEKSKVAKISERASFRGKRYGFVSKQAANEVFALIYGKKGGVSIAFVSRVVLKSYDAFLNNLKHGNTSLSEEQYKALSTYLTGEADGLKDYFVVKGDSMPWKIANKALHDKRENVYREKAKENVPKPEARKPVAEKKDSDTVAINVCGNEAYIICNQLFSDMREGRVDEKDLPIIKSVWLRLTTQLI